MSEGQKETEDGGQTIAETLTADLAKMSDAEIELKAIEAFERGNTDAAKGYRNEIAKRHPEDLERAA